MGSHGSGCADSSELSSRGRRHLPAAIGYLLLTGWVLWPALAHFRTRATANAVDGAMFSWLWGVMPDAVAAGDSPYRTDLIFHPIGADLRLTTTAPLVALVTWPVRATLGLQAQVNLIQLSAMFLAAMAAYVLAERVCRHRGAAFVAGIAYALLPARFIHMEGSLNLIWTAVIPFGLLLLLRFVEVPTWGRAVALGVGCGGSFLVDPQLCVLLVLGLLVLGLVKAASLAPQLPKLGVSLAVALLVAAPLLAPMLIAVMEQEIGRSPPTVSTLRDSASPVSWIAPPLRRLWIGNHLPDLAPVTPAWEGVAYPGIIMLGLAIAGTTVGPVSRRKGWVALTFVAFVLSLGPYLFVGDTSLDVPLPFFAMRFVPGLDAMRVPGRFGLLGALGICVLAATCLAEIGRRFPERRGVVVAVAALVTLVELYPRALPSRDDSVPAAYEAIAADHSNSAVLEIPLKWSVTKLHHGFEGQDQDFRFLLYQLEHGHPIVSGAVSRYPDEDLERLIREPVYRQVLALAGQPGFDDPADFGRADLAELGIGFVVYHRDDPVPRALAYVRSLGLEQLSDDGSVIVWAVDR